MRGQYFCRVLTYGVVVHCILRQHTVLQLNGRGEIDAAKYSSQLERLWRSGHVHGSSFRITVTPILKFYQPVGGFPCLILSVTFTHTQARYYRLLTLSLHVLEIPLGTVKVSKSSKMTGNALITVHACTL